MTTGIPKGRTMAGLGRRLVGFTSAGGAMAVALIMALSPAAAAAGHTYHAPYAGAVSQTYSSTSQSGCATGALTAPVNWSSTTGVLTMAAKASAKSCGVQLAGVGGNSYGSAYGQAEVAIPIKAATSALHTITVNWKLHAVASTTFVPGTCTISTTTTFFQYCETGAGVSVYGFAYLVDLTNGTYFYPSNYWSFYNESYNETYCYSGTCYNSSGSFGYGSLGNVSWFINGTLNKLDSYAIVTYMEGSAYAFAEAYTATLTGGSGSASISMAGGPNKATLSSIVVT